MNLWNMYSCLLTFLFNVPWQKKQEQNERYCYLDVASTPLHEDWNTVETSEERIETQFKLCLELLLIAWVKFRCSAGGASLWKNIAKKLLTTAIFILKKNLGLPGQWWAFTETFRSKRFLFKIVIQHFKFLPLLAHVLARLSPSVCSHSGEVV